MQLEVGKKYVLRDTKFENLKGSGQYTEYVVITGRCRTDLYSGKRYDIDGNQFSVSTWTEDGRYYSHKFKHESDLIAEYKEHDMKKSDKLKQLIQDMPVCDDGKAKITALVEEMTGEKLEAGPKPATGQVWEIDGVPRLFICVQNCEYIIDFNGRPATSCDFEEGLMKYKYRFVANSLDEYYEKKARGEL